MAIENLTELLGEELMPAVSTFKFIAHMIDVFGSPEKLKEFVKKHQDKDYTVFDYDWSLDSDEVHYKNMFLAMINESPEESLTLIPFFRPNNDGFCRFWDTLNKFEDKEFAGELWRKLFSQQYFVQEAGHNGRCQIAWFTHPALKLLKSCCDPNVVIHSNRQDVILTVLHPISSGSVIRVSSGPYYKENKHVPKLCLNSDPNSCEPCNNKWVHQIDQDIITEAMDNMQDFFDQNDPKQLSTQLDNLQLCSDFINENFDGYYSDAEKRTTIATKIIELEKTLRYIGFPFPIMNVFLTMRGSDGIEKYNRLLKLTEFNFNKNYKVKPRDLIYEKKTI